MVSDASPLAGLPTGDYFPWEVDASGKIIVAGTPYLIPYRLRGDTIEVLRVFHGARQWPPTPEPPSSR